MERIVYEFKPFICLATASYAMSQAEINPIGKLCAIFLVACGAFILYGRLKSRGYIN